MAVGPEKEEVVLHKKEKKKKHRKNKKAEAGLVEAISFSSETRTGEVGGSRVGLMMYDKEHKRKEMKKKKEREEKKEKKEEKKERKEKKKKKVESTKESELNVIVEDIVNVKDHAGAKKKKRKLEPNERKNDQEKYKVKAQKGDKLKKNKGKEQKKEKMDTGKGAVISTFVEVLKDNEEGGFKETNGLKDSNKEDESNLKEYEGHHKKDKKQKNVKNKKMNGLEYSEKKRKKNRMNKETEELEYSQKKRKKNRMNKETEELENCEVEDVQEWEQGDEERKKQEKKDYRVKERGDIETPKMKRSDKVSGEKKKSVVRSREFENKEDFINGSSEEKVEYTKKGMNRGEQEKNHINGCSREFLIENSTSDGKAISDYKEVAYNEGHPSSSNKKRGREKGGLDDEMEKREKKNRKKSKLVNDVEEKGVDYGNLRTKDSTSDHSKNLEPKKSPKRVKFSGHVEVFPSSDATGVGVEREEQKLVQGKRFSKEEDQMIKDAVYNFIQVHGLGENGLHMVLHCKKFPEARNCWKEIATSLPWRPLRTIYWRAHNLFTRGKPNWTAEEKALIIKFYNENGPDWTTLAQALGKHRIHLKDIWRQIRYPNLKRGQWSQEEYQTLFELVNLDLQMKVHEEKNTKHGMLRDNISWTAISEKLGTRTSEKCCRKWYHELTSSMVKTGEWGDADDYRLLNELLMLDACCVEEVDWDNLIDQRSGEACLKRWKQMCLHIGNHGIKPFAEQVEVLARRYCPSLLEVREALDSRPVV